MVGYGLHPWEAWQYTVPDAMARVQGEHTRYKEQMRLFAWVISAVSGEPVDKLMGETKPKPAFTEEQLRQMLRDEQAYLERMKPL